MKRKILQINKVFNTLKIKYFINQIKNKGSPITFIFLKKLSNIWNIISKERKVVYYIITNFV